MTIRVGDCPFCTIAASPKPGEILVKNGGFFAVHARSAEAAHHLLVIPFDHVEGLAEAIESSGASYVGALVVAADEMARALGIGPNYALRIHAGTRAHVRHLHAHVLGR